MLEQAVRDFLMLFITIEPIGALALFVALTAGLSAAERRKTAIRATLYSAGILLAFLVLGQLLLSGLGIRLVSFQLAGGIVLFLLAIQMVFGTGVAAPGGETEPGHDLAVFPIAVPNIAGPGAIAAIVVLTDNHRHSIPEQLLTAAMLLTVLLLTLVLLLLANPIHRALGRAGSNLVVRVMGLILAALAAELVVAGLEEVLRGHPTA